jgi:lipoic acid synthetase
LIPDFRGVWDALQMVIDTPPDVLSHNLETVPRKYRRVRPQAKYERSLELLLRVKEAGIRSKTGIMVGLGETREEVIELMQGCVDHKVDVLTIGQYMQPTKMHHPVMDWVHPDQFAEYKEIGEKLGIEHVESGPLVRSSYHAERHV